MTSVELSEAKRELLQRMMSGSVAPDRTREATGVTPRALGTDAPISPDQRQVWLHAEMAPDVPIYNEVCALHRKGGFDLEVMERSFNEFLRRHEIWRTSFRFVGEDIVQVVHPGLRVRLAVDDLTHLPRAEREAEARRIAAEDARRPFDLSEAPLFRARVLKLADDEHRLCLALHHIIFDGVSLAHVFVPEVAALYEAFSRGAGSPLAEPSLQFGDYAVWRREQLASDRIERQMDHWRHALGGRLPKLELAADRPRPPVPTCRGALEAFALPPELAEKLKALGRSEGVTLYMTLLAAFKAMLFRYTSQEDILIGGVTDLRRRPELERLMGYFLNIIPLRTKPSAGLPFRDYLAQVRKSVLGALEASEAPFDRVARELSVGRERGAHPFFQAVFSIQPLDAFPQGWDLTQTDVLAGGAKFDLFLELEERRDGISGRFIYASDVFEAATVRRMVGHLRAILEAVVADPGRPLGRLPMMTESELRQVLVEWNATDAAIPASTLHEWFRAQAQRTPNSIAVEFEGRAWTYRELDRRSDAFACRLQQAGVAAETLVGICMRRSLDMVAGVLGIFKAGGAYLPLDPAFPEARLAYIMEDARPAALLTEKGLLGKVDAGGLPVILCEAIDGTETAPAVAAVNGESLAYVIYTSGSTGRPKGAEIRHSALVNLLAAMQREQDFTPRDSLLALATLSFDLAAYELLLPLVSGGRVIVAAREAAADPVRLAELIERSGTSVVAATPATWRALIETGWGGGEGLSILCGGEPMSRRLAEDLRSRSGALWNVYGPTETTIFSTVHRMRRDDDPAPIGRPIANNRHYILDPAGNAVPVGVVGELYIGGAGLARGYRNRPDLTEERFVERPVAPGARLYRTGDLARYRPDGAIEYRGRIDAEEKIRGFRVAVEEIEAALARHPDIASAAVRSWTDASGNKALTACFVIRDRREPIAAELRRFLAETLPDFMIPSRFARLDALPMTPTGKVDRKALPETQGEVLRAALRPPQGEAEERLAEIWKATLGVAEVGRDEDFFDLGGHSLLVANLLRRIELEYGRRLTMAAFFHGPTIEGMAQLLAADSPSDLPKTIPIQPRGRRPPLLWLDGSPTFLALARGIGLDQPFLGVPVDPVLERNAVSTLRLEEAAAAVVETIRDAQPLGPYYLGGWCNMGTLAYEVAAQLQASGQPVNLVILLDATNPASYRRIGRVAFFLSRLRYYLPRLWRRPIAEWGSEIAQRVRNMLRTYGFAPAPAAASRHEELHAIFARTVREYRPPVYCGDVVLFQPRERLDVQNFRPGWAECVRGELGFQEVPGAHVTMLMEPHVEELAAAMRAALLRAQERDTRTPPLQAVA